MEAGPDNPPRKRGLQSGRARLRIMETTDLHMHLMPFDYVADRPAENVGLVRTASLIRKARASCENTLLFDTGDFLQGSPVGDVATAPTVPKRKAPHPMIQAMNQLGYDAVAIGNHEFGHGLAFLEEAVAAADFPCLCANVARMLGPSPIDDQTLFPATALIRRTIRDSEDREHGLAIGVVAVLPPQILLRDRAQTDFAFETRTMIEAATAHVADLHLQGADIVVVLAHSGIEMRSPAASEDSTVALATIPGVDALLAGHTHMVFPSHAFDGIAGIDVSAGTVLGTPAVMAGAWGSHLGVIDLQLSRAGNGWRVVDHCVNVLPISERSEDGRVTPLVSSDHETERVVMEVHRRTRALLNCRVGQTARPLHSYFALLGRSPALAIVAEAQRVHAEILVRDSGRAGRVLSAVAPFKAGGHGGPDFFTDIAAGPLTRRAIADLYLYANAFAVVEVSGRVLREWLDRSAAGFNQILPSDDAQPLLNPEAPSYSIDVIYGLDYVIDLSVPARYDTEGRLARPDASRITSLSYQGMPVADEERFLVATNSHRVAGGGNYPLTSETRLAVETAELNRDVVERYIGKAGTLAQQDWVAWRFAPLGGIRTWIDTGPGATRHLDVIADLQPAVQPSPVAGFQRLILSI